MKHVEGIFSEHFGDGDLENSKGALRYILYSREPKVTQESGGSLDSLGARPLNEIRTSRIIENKASADDVLAEYFLAERVAVYSAENDSVEV